MLWSIILIALFLATLLGIWLTATRRRLAVMDDNASNAMGQLGLLIASRFDALTSLIRAAQASGAQGAEGLLEAVNSRPGNLTAHSVPGDVRRQEAILSGVLQRIQELSVQYPSIRENEDYQRYLGAVEIFGKMADTGRLIYNDSAARLNGAIKRFPICFLAGLLGFHQRDCLEPGGADPLHTEETNIKGG